MAITLSSELEAMVREDAGLCGFETAEAYLADRLVEMHERELFLSEHRQAISDMIDEGWEQAQRGELLTPEEAKKQRDDAKREFLAKREAA